MDFLYLQHKGWSKHICEHCKQLLMDTFYYWILECVYADAVSMYKQNYIQARSMRRRMRVPVCLAQGIYLGPTAFEKKTVSWLSRVGHRRNIPGFHILRRDVSGQSCLDANPCEEHLVIIMSWGYVADSINRKHTNRSASQISVVHRLFGGDRVDRGSSVC